MGKLAQACSEYNPDEDISKYRGSMGIALAEASLKPFGYNLERYKFKQMLNSIRTKIRKKDSKLERQSKNIYR